jgi:hypothetical protein
MHLTPKAVVKSIVACCPPQVRDQLLALRKRIQWGSKSNSSHLTYFEDYHSRMPFILAVKELLEGLGDAPGTRSLIEFGCSGGNNLRLLRESSPILVRYCGLDINPSAIAFAREKFPDATFHIASDGDLNRLAPQLGHFDVFLAAAVLYYLPHDRAQAVLNLAASLAEYILVCDDLRCFSHSTGKTEGNFFHPFAAMCRRAGMSVIVPPTRLRDGDNHSYFIARSTMPPTL